MPRPGFEPGTTASSGQRSPRLSYLGSKKERYKYLRVDGGRVVYQFTIRAKLPEVASGVKYRF